MNIILFDTPDQWTNLLPLTYTRPVADLRCGILTIKEKWEKLLGANISFLTREYLSNKFPEIKQSINLFINGSLLPDKVLAEKIHNLKVNEVLINNDIILAANLSADNEFDVKEIFKYKCIVHAKNVSMIKFPWDLFLLNGQEIKNDIDILFKNKKTNELSNTNNLLGKENIYVEDGVKAEFVTINAQNGPVYLGKYSEVMEGAVIRGPFALCEHSTLKLSAKVYGPVTIGPHSKVGGEISESIIQGYSNKAHDGYLGNSVLGEWCNLGADTNTSNLKNNYEPVKVWNYAKERFLNSGLQFCGLIMGDHSKSGINTMFNTGTVVGISANIFGPGFPRNFIPSYSWGGAQGLVTYKMEKAFEVAEKVMARRKLAFSKTDQDIMKHIFEETIKYRR